MMARIIDNDQIHANGNIIAGGDIQSGDKIIEKNIENMNAVFNTNNYYVGLSPQQYEELTQDILSKVKYMLEKKEKEDIIIPDRDIFIPAMQILTNKFEREDIREMFIKLLSNSMDKKTKEKVHPSYVDILKNMDSLDAALFKKLLEKKVKYIKTINPKIAIKGTDKVFTNALPDWFVDVNIARYDMFQISKSLINLDRLGIIELMYDRTAGTDGYDILEENLNLKEILKKYQYYNQDKDLELKSTRSIINVTEYGRELAQICL